MPNGQCGAADFLFFRPFFVIFAPQSTRGGFCPGTRPEASYEAEGRRRPGLRLAAGRQEPVSGNAGACGCFCIR